MAKQQITVTDAEKLEWARMAQHAYKHGDNFTGHRYSALAALPRGATLPVDVYDSVQRNYRDWLVGYNKNPRKSLRDLKRAEAEHYARPAVSIDIDVDSHNAKRGSKTRVNPSKFEKQFKIVEVSTIRRGVALVRAKNGLKYYVHAKDVNHVMPKLGEDIRNYDMLEHANENPLKGEKHIALQEKRGGSWFTIAYFPHSQKALAIKLGKQVHRRYPHKELRVFA